jgi:predicted HD phosphohydrolase
MPSNAPPDSAAPIIRPFVEAKTHWVVEHHGIFQGYYFFHYLGMNRDMREAFRGHEHFEDTARFCELYDQSAFDAGYDSAPLEFFEPMVRRVFERPVNSVYRTVGETAWFPPMTQARTPREPGAWRNTTSSSPNSWPCARRIRSSLAR